MLFKEMPQHTTHDAPIRELLISNLVNLALALSDQGYCILQGLQLWVAACEAHVHLLCSLMLYGFYSYSRKGAN